MRSRFLSVLLIVSLCLPIVEGFFVPKRAQAAGPAAPVESSGNKVDRTDYLVTVDQNGKSKIWSYLENKNILQTELNSAIQSAQNGTGQYSDVGIQFVMKNSASPNSSLPGLISPVEVLGISQPINFGVFFVFIKGPESHPLTPCVNTNVNHYNIIVKRSSSTPDSQAWTNLHIGKYYSNGRACLVVFDNLHPWLCIKICSPTQQQLINALYTVLIAAGVVASAYIIMAAAIAIAPIIWPLFLAL